jgi:hypothetical protein
MAKPTPDLRDFQAEGKEILQKIAIPVKLADCFTEKK